MRNDNLFEKGLNGCTISYFGDKPAKAREICPLKITHGHPVREWKKLNSKFQKSFEVQFAYVHHDFGWGGGLLNKLQLSAAFPWWRKGLVLIHAGFLAGTWGLGRTHLFLIELEPASVSVILDVWLEGGRDLLAEKSFPVGPVEPSVRFYLFAAFCPQSFLRVFAE